MTCLTIPIGTLDSVDHLTHTQRDENALTLATSLKHLDLLSHPLCYRLLQEKWTVYGQSFPAVPTACAS